MSMKIDLSGVYEAELSDGSRHSVKLPGTLDEARVGKPDDPAKQWHSEIVASRGKTQVIETRFTRPHSDEGPVAFRRELFLKELPEGKRFFVKAERSRKLSLSVNGEETLLVFPGSVSTPWLFEVKSLREGRNELCFTADNTYPGMPAGAIRYSSAASDETQTNWNGILGEISLFSTDEILICGSRIFLKRDGSGASCFVELSFLMTEEEAAKKYGETRPELPGTVRILSSVFRDGSLEKTVTLIPGDNRISFDEAALLPDLSLWGEDPEDFGSGLFSAEVFVQAEEEKRTLRAEHSFSFGLRRFESDDAGRLTLNGHRIFLRGEANCCVFPETGHAPMDADSWREIIRRYQAYGVNCLRFHSHCPPEAAFTAADELGMLMQPELSHWDPEHAFEDDISYRYYRNEMLGLFRMLAGHPSFVMLTLGNELCCGKPGEKRMASLVNEAKKELPDRLYARGSNAFYGAKGCDRESDFYTAQNYGAFQMRAISAASDESRPKEKVPIKGYLNNVYPNALTDYREGMAALREAFPQPMFSFEVGQYETLPDFHEIEEFHGVCDPENYRLIKNRAEEKGLLPIWDRMLEAGGEIALLGYREECEAVLRTPEMSGLSFLSLQDFPGQGTAIVGMMNAHLEPKTGDFARPERFRAFYRDVLPLPGISGYTYTSGGRCFVRLQTANYGKKDLSGEYRLELCLNPGKNDEIRRMEAVLPDCVCPCGALTDHGTAEFLLPAVSAPAEAVLSMRLVTRDPSEEIINTRRIWIYPEEDIPAPEGVYVTECFDEQAEEVLERGGSVFLQPPSKKQHFPGGIRGQFTTDFWSVGTFPQQEGGMGLLIEENHPLFEAFPTSFHTDYQWWPMARRVSMRFPDESFSEGFIVRQMDSYSMLRSLAVLAEYRLGNGKIFISSLGLRELSEYPEARALLNAVHRYLGSPSFEPKARITAEQLRQIVH